MFYKEILSVDKYTAKYINDALHIVNYIGEDETIRETVKFSNGYEADIKCCGARDDRAWAEADLYDEKGYHIMYGDPDDEFFKDWDFIDDDDNEYMVTVKVSEDSPVNYEEVLKLSPIMTNFIDDALKYGGIGDDIIVETVRFGNGYMAEVRCCGDEDDVAWTEAELFDEKGKSVYYLGRADRFFKDWHLRDYNGNTYTVKAEKSEE